MKQSLYGYEIIWRTATLLKEFNELGLPDSADSHQVAYFRGCDIEGFENDKMKLVDTKLIYHWRQILLRAEAQ